MEEQSIAIRYMVTRSCLEEGVMRLLKYNQRFFPNDGPVQFTDDRGREYAAEVDLNNRCVWNLGPLYDTLGLGVNDVLLVHPVTAHPPYTHFWVSAELDPHQSTINRVTQTRPRPRPRQPAPKTSLLPKVDELLTPPWGLPPELKPRMELGALDVEAAIETLPFFEALDTLEREQHQWESEHGWVTQPYLEQEILRPQQEGISFAQSSLFGPPASQTPNQHIPWEEIGENFEASFESVLPEPRPETGPAKEPAEETAANGPSPLPTTNDAAKDNPADLADAANLAGAGQANAAQANAAQAEAPAADENAPNFLSELIERELAREEALAKAAPQQQAASPAEPVMAAELPSFAASPFVYEGPEDVFLAKVSIPVQPALPQVVPTPSLPHQPPPAPLPRPLPVLQEAAVTQGQNSVQSSVPVDWGDQTVVARELEALHRPKEQPLEEPLDLYRDEPLTAELSYQPEGFAVPAASGSQEQARQTSQPALAAVPQSSLGDFDHVFEDTSAQASQLVQEFEFDDPQLDNPPASSKHTSSHEGGQDRPEKPRPQEDLGPAQATQSAQPAEAIAQRALLLSNMDWPLGERSPQAPISSSLLEQVAEFARLTGYRLQVVHPNLLQLNADLGPQFGYRVLLALDHKALEQPAWLRPEEDYRALLVSEGERPSKVSRLTKEALLALIEHARLAPLSPVDLHGYWRSGSLDLEASSSIAALASAYLAQRGTFSFVLLTLAAQQANSVITLSRLAARLGSGIDTDDLRAILDTLSKPPFLALTALPNGQYILRRSMPEMLEELIDYSQAIRRRMHQQQDEGL